MTEQDATTPGPSRRARRAGRDKGEVLAAAVRVITERGADATRFTDVAQASGVPVSTLQYYFGSREDMLAAAFRHASEVELAALRPELQALPDPWDRLARIVDAALADFRAVEGQTGHLWVEAWRFGMRDPDMRTDVLADYAAWRGLIADAVQEGVGGGRFHTALEPDRVAVLLLALLDGLGMPLAIGDPAVTFDEARDGALAALSTMLGLD